MNDDREILHRRAGEGAQSAASGAEGGPDLDRLRAATDAADAAESATEQMLRLVGSFSSTDIVNSGGQ